MRWAFPALFIFLAPTARALAQLTLPKVAITSPTEGSVLEEGPTLIRTATSDQAGHITKVQFFTNGVLIGENTQEPFSFLWSAPKGRFQVFARVYDSFFAYDDSAPVYVQVGAATPLALRRGPYLQSGAPTSMVLRWRTDWFCESVVRFGTNLSLPYTVTDETLVIDHEVKLTGLQANTRYYYSIGTEDQTFAQGNQCYFHTSPTNSQPMRIWIIGDSGTADTNADQVRIGYEDANTGLTDVWLMLGDNAYGSGYDYEYQKAVFEMYPAMLRKTVLWPTLGNHDAGDNVPGHFVPYLDIFTLPKNGEAGGVPSGTELYYSFDYANVHFICLDSYTSDRSSNGPMASWLQADLGSTDKDWIIAYWHHPPYSKGGHDSDDDYFLFEMRQNLVPILEAYGVDLVLSGHSHDYERSFLLDGHYGYSWELQPAMILDRTLGRAAQPYRKPAGGLGAHRGAVYAVCGCSGAGGQENVPQHPAMALALGGFGSMVVNIDGLRLQAQFIRPTLAADDTFVIDKSAPADIHPRLAINRGTNGPIVSWPTSVPTFDLVGADRLPVNAWQRLSISPRTAGRRNIVEFTNNAPQSFFRLQSRSN